MLKFGKKNREKRGITYFGLEGHEVAVLKSTMENTSDLAAEYEMRDPNEAATCDIVVVNQDSKVAASWWKNLAKRNPSALAMFLTNEKQTADGSAYCKRPFSPSFVQAAFKDFVSRNNPGSQVPQQP